jgi:hypothetical protein
MASTGSTTTEKHTNETSAQSESFFRLPTMDNWDPEFRNILLNTVEIVSDKSSKVLFMIIFVIIILIFFLIMANDKKALGSSFLAYIITFGILLFTGLLVLYSEIKGWGPYFAIFGIVLAIVFLIFHKDLLKPNSVGDKIKYFFIYDYPKYNGLSDETSFFITYSLKMILVIIILLALSIFYNLFLNQAYRQKNVIGFIIQFIFFIPCLLGDAVNYIIKDFQRSPPLVYILLGIEILLVLLYIFVPKLLKSDIQKNGHQLLKAPVFLSDRRSLDNCNYAMMTYMKDLDALDVPDRGMPANPAKFDNSEYAFSFWLNTNETPANGDKQFNIFYLGNDFDRKKPSGKPYLYYDNSYNDTPFTFVFTDDNLPVGSVDKQDILARFTYRTDLPRQRWNHIVLNYLNHRVDLFINGELVHSISFTVDTDGSGSVDSLHTPLLRANDNNILLVGDKQESIHGAICNIMVYRKALMAEQIVQAYNLLNLRNPPI